MNCGIVSSPRLFLITPTEIDSNSFSTQLDDALSGNNVAILLIATDLIASNNISNYFSEIIQIAHRHKISVLIQNNVSFVKELAVDGIQIDELEVLKQTMKNSKPYDIIGTGGITSKHDAMIKGETQVDYIFFGNITDPEPEFSSQLDLELSEWWAENFRIPGVTLAGHKIESIKVAASTGIDFVAARDAIWNYPDGPKLAVAKANEILSEYRIRE